MFATTFTTIAGFIPLIIEGGGFWPPLAVTIAGGVTGATLLALVFVPSSYLLVNRVTQGTKERERKAADRLPTAVDHVAAELAVTSDRHSFFQPAKSAGLNATFHFTFTGHEQRQTTVVIQEQKLSVEEGHVGEPDLHVTADSQTWIGFLRKEKTIVWALLRRKVRLVGPLKLPVAFGKCFSQ